MYRRDIYAMYVSLYNPITEDEDTPTEVASITPQTTIIIVFIILGVVLVIVCVLLVAFCCCCCRCCYGYRGTRGKKESYYPDIG